MWQKKQSNVIFIKLFIYINEHLNENILTNIQLYMIVQNFVTTSEVSDNIVGSNMKLWNMTWCDCRSAFRFENIISK